jgi:predicted kinase
VAAPLHWALIFDLVRSVLEQGFSCVLDGMASFTLVRERGRAIAEAAGAAYLIIDCWCPDLAVLQERIDSKTLLSSHWKVAGLRTYSRPGTTPLTEPHLVLDTRRPFEDYLAEALEYVRPRAGEGP